MNKSIDQLARIIDRANQIGSLKADILTYKEMLDGYLPSKAKTNVLRNLQAAETRLEQLLGDQS